MFYSLFNFREASINIDAHAINSIHLTPDHSFVCFRVLIKRSFKPNSTFVVLLAISGPFPILNFKMSAFAYFGNDCSTRIIGFHYFIKVRLIIIIIVFNRLFIIRFRILLFCRTHSLRQLIQITITFVIKFPFLSSVFGPRHITFLSPHFMNCSFVLTLWFPTLFWS